MNPSHVLLAGIGVLSLGMALVFVGVVVPGVFRAGLVLVTAGLVLCAAAGVLGVIRASIRAGDAKGAG